MSDVPTRPAPLYTREFFQVFAAVLLFMIGVAIQFHFGQYFQFLGFHVDTLGRVLGISMIGTLCIRLWIGHWIDRYGCKLTWLTGIAVVTVSVGTIQFVHNVWLIAALRTAVVMATALVMTNVPVFASRIAPPHRRAESIGILGLSGLLGIAIGPSLGDLIFAHTDGSMGPFHLFFTATAACSLIAGVIIYLTPLPTADQADLPPLPDMSEPPPRPERLWRIIRRHWPGMILLVGVVFSMAFCIQQTFLERLAEARGFKNVKVYFVTYGFTAITLRLLTRRAPELFGRTRTCLSGLICLAAGLATLTGSRAEWHLLLPALFMGAGHSLVFPSMVDLAAHRLPPAHRGTGTSLILGAGDLGTLLGFVSMGEMIARFGFNAALYALTGTVLLAALAMAVTNRQHLFGRRTQESPPITG